MQNSVDIIVADWDAPESIVALSTTRNGGVSRDGFSSWNLASHVNDDETRVRANRNHLKQELDLTSEPAWLEQTHSTRVINLDRDTGRNGDAAITTDPGKIAVVLTADCLPVLFTNKTGDEVAAAHAGWRGLVNGILEQTIQAMESPPAELMAWMGPAIGPDKFEVGPEVYRAFVEHSTAASGCFRENRPQHYLADIYGLARLRLNQSGIEHIWGGDYCTYSQNERFFSYRREMVTGRQASLIYIKQ